jgi:tripartite-type tricarboxylate transporter receptor subunit TctC
MSRINKVLRVRQIPEIGRRKLLKGVTGIAVALARRGSLTTMAGTAVLAAGAQGRADDDSWPNRPVRFIVPLAAGGGLDFVARVVGERVAREIGQQVVIENRTGAGGRIGIDTAIKSAPDGYSVLITNDNVASAPHVLGLNVDYLKELLPVAILGLQPQALAAHPSLDRVNSVADLITLVKQRPGMGCATSGVGSNQHVLLAWFSRDAQIKLDHVPYRGAGQAINDVLAGHVQVAFLGPTALLPQYKAGKLRLLAQTGHGRSRSLPEVPTLEESGFPGLVLESWYAAFVPLGTPPALIARLNAAIGKALADSGTRAHFDESATEVAGGPPEDLARLAREDSEKYARLVQELNIRPN